MSFINKVLIIIYEIIAIIISLFCLLDYSTGGALVIVEVFAVFVVLNLSGFILFEILNELRRAIK